MDKLDIETEFPTDEEIARKFGWEDAYHTNGLSLWQKAKPKIYSLFDEPHSSTCARVRGSVYIRKWNQKAGNGPLLPLELVMPVKTWTGIGLFAAGVISVRHHRDEIYSLQILLNRTQAGPGRTVKQEQGETSLNHVQRLNLISVVQLVKKYPSGYHIISRNDILDQSIEMSTGQSAQLIG